MTCHDLVPGVTTASAEDPPSTGDRIGANLRRAFPLPANGHGSDERFQELLDALARRGGGNIPKARS